MNKKKLILIITFLFPLIVAFQHQPKPQKVYKVYLQGKAIGIIESKQELINYINKRQEKIKKVYKVTKVYEPNDLKITKEITYDNNLLTVEEIYNKIDKISPFTIKGYSIKVSGTTKNTNIGIKIKTKTQYIYVKDKKIFEEAAHNTAKSFITEQAYKDYKSKNQEPIKDTGKIIENIYIKNKITIKKTNVPINKKIYLTQEELSQYLLFGNDSKESYYKTQVGDTLEKIAFDNKLSVEELLVSNPEIKGKDTLLYTGQELKISEVKPQIDIVEEDHIVKKEEKQYPTETKEDNNQLATYQKTEQAGVKGENKVTQKIQKVNGEIVNTVTVNTEVLKEPIKEIIIKGTKPVSRGPSGGGAAGRPYGTVVATKGTWGWPASCGSPATVSSGYGYRWGGFHDGADISGCGYNSAIFAAQAGTVLQSSFHGINGQFIVIDHHNGIYTYYGHLCNGCRYVKQGDKVNKGQVIGGMGSTGIVTGVHLHFGMYTGIPKYGARGNSVNPMAFY